MAQSNYPEILYRPTDNQEFVHVGEGKYAVCIKGETLNSTNDYRDLILRAFSSEPNKEKCEYCKVCKVGLVTKYNNRFTCSNCEGHPLEILGLIEEWK